MKEVKAVVFDAYGTLFNINSLDQLLADYYGETAGELSALWRRKQLEYTWLSTLMGQYKPFSDLTMDALTYSCGYFGLSLTGEIRQKLYHEYFRLPVYSEVPSVLEDLSEKAWLGVLSNADKPMLQSAIDHNNLARYFRQVISVEDIELFKPRPEVYQMACDYFQLTTDQLLFVSSNTWDVAGAKSFGLKAASLNRIGGVFEELGFQPDYVLDEMKQLLAVFSS